MKTIFQKSLAILMACTLLLACNNSEEQLSAPEIPPFETMVVDFGELGPTDKSAVAEQDMMTKVAWGYSALSVGLWNVLIGTTFAIPVASFKSAFGNLPSYLGENTWEWNYAVDGFTSTYTARLVGEKQASQIKWEMYVSKTGVESFDEFLWFEGTSALNRESGQWILYHSPQYPEHVIQIDWKKEAEEVGEVKYTYVRELDNEREPDSFKDSYLIYGLQDEDFDAYVTIHAFNETSSQFNDSFIEWSRTNYSGRAKAEHFFNDEDWHCWDSEGNDVACN